jgi:pimeloyl-ACP methyl ester carboxylesterase
VFAIDFPGQRFNRTHSGGHTRCCPHEGGFSVRDPSEASLRRRPSPSSGRQRNRDVGAFRVSIRNPTAPGTPLLMLNGVGAELRLWNNLRRNIDRPSLAFDVQAGHLGRRPSMRTFAANVARLLDDLQLDTVDVLGLSWGGMAAQQLAHDHPDRLRRLVLASTTPGFVSVPARPTSTLALLRPSRSAKRAERLSEHLYAGDFLRDPSLIHRLGLLRPMDGRTYRRQMWAVTGWSSALWLHTIRHETLILHGDDDPVVPFVNARLMQRVMPRATLRRVERGGHLYLYTRPQVHGRQIDEFLSSARPPASARPVLASG